MLKVGDRVKLITKCSSSYINVGDEGVITASDLSSIPYLVTFHNLYFVWLTADSIEEIASDKDVNPGFHLVPPVCDCGKDKHGFAKHIYWCETEIYVMKIEVKS